MGFEVTQILFLRAVNLGKTNKVPMKRLMELMQGERLGNPAFLLQSGNVIVTDPQLRPAALARRTESLILQEFGVTTVAIVRTPPQLARAVAANPYTAPVGGNVHMAFWAEAPEASNLEALAEESFVGAQLSLAAGTAYMRFEGSTHNSKLNNALLERRLKVPATSRSVTTLERLLAHKAVSSELTPPNEDGDTQATR